MPETDSIEPRIRLLPPSVWAVMALAVVLTAGSVWIAAGDGQGEHDVLGNFMLAAILPTAWAVLLPLWRRDGSAALAIMRAGVVGLASGIVVGVTAGIAVSVPAVAERITAHARSNGDHYWFIDGERGPLASALLMGAVGAAFFAMLAGLVLAVVIVLPGLAFLPRRGEQAHPETAPDAQAATANRSAGRLAALLLLVCVAAPTLIIVGANAAQSATLWEMLTAWPRVFTELGLYWGDALWALGVLLVPVGVLIIVQAYRLQRRVLASLLQQRGRVEGGTGDADTLS